MQKFLTFFSFIVFPSFLYAFFFSIFFSGKIVTVWFSTGIGHLLRILFNRLSWRTFAPEIAGSSWTLFSFTLSMVRNFGNEFRNASRCENQCCRLQIVNGDDTCGWWANLEGGVVVHVPWERAWLGQCPCSLAAFGCLASSAVSKSQTRLAQLQHLEFWEIEVQKSKGALSFGQHSGHLVYVGHGLSCGQRVSQRKAAGRHSKKITQKCSTKFELSRCYLCLIFPCDYWMDHEHAQRSKQISYVCVYSFFLFVLVFVLLSSASAQLFIYKMLGSIVWAQVIYKCLLCKYICIMYISLI